MRKLTKLLIPAIVLVAVVMAFSVMTVSAAEATQLEWTGGTTDEAAAFLDNALKTAEAGSDVVITLKANMDIDYGSKTFKALGTATTTDKVVTITSAANGDSYYRFFVGKNTILNIYGNITFKNVVLEGTNNWSGGSAMGTVEGKLLVEDSVVMEPNTYDKDGKLVATSQKRLNVFGVDVELYAGNYRTISANYYANTGALIKNPTIVVAGNCMADQIVARDLSCYHSSWIGTEGTSTLSILGNASASNVSAGEWQPKHGHPGDSTLNVNTNGTIGSIVLAGTTTANNLDFQGAHYTLNVLGGQVKAIHLVALETGTVSNLHATFNLGDATYNSMIWFGANEPKSSSGNGLDYGVAIKDSTVVANITGGTFKSDVYCGSHFEYYSSKDNGSYEDIDKVVNITGNPDFKGQFFGGTYARHGKNPARGDLVLNIEGGTFAKMVFGGSQLLREGTLGADEKPLYTLGGGIHSGNIEMNVSGGTFKNHLSGGSYLRVSNADHAGEIKLTINGAIEKTGGRLMGGSIPTAGVHSGDITMILGGSEKSSIVNQIVGGSYIDGASAKHTGDITVKIEGSADWSTTVVAGSFVAKNNTTVCPEETPAEIKVIVDASYTGEAGTIMAGHWYNGSQTQNSTAAANYSVEVNGGLVSSIIGHSTNYEGNKTPGNTDITVNGGTVLSIEGYTNIDTGSKINIVVKDTATRVIGVKGYTKGTAGENVTLTYDRAVMKSSEVSGVQADKVTATGDKNAVPAPYDFTLYVANESKGLGDGSSPENAMGHDADYYDLWNEALWYIKANNGTNSGLVEPAKSLVGKVYKKNALYKAMTYKSSRIQITGGTIVVCDVLTINATDAMRTVKGGMADFWAGGISGPANSKSGEVTITSIDPYTGDDYRWKGARLVLDGAEVGLCVNFSSPTKLDHLTIENRYNSVNGKSIDQIPVIAGMGNKLEIGYDVFVWCNDINPTEDKRVDLYPSIMGGHRYTNTKTDHYVSVGSGTWAAVVGGSWNVAHTGNATVAIDGSAKVTTVCGTVKPTSSNAKHNFDGSCWIGLWGGEVDNVYVVGKPGMIWGDASVGVGGTKINGKVRATHPDYAGDPVQGWAFNYTDAQLEEGKFVGFDNPVPETGSSLVIYAVVAAVSLLGAAIVISVKRKSVEE